MGQTLTVLLRVDSDVLPTILGCVAGSAEIVKIEATDGPAAPVPAAFRHAETVKRVEEEAAARAAKPHRYANGIRNKGIGGKALILQCLGETPLRVWGADELKRRFVLRGFAASSVSPNTSELVDEKKIERVAENRYALPGVVRPQLSLTA